MVRIGLAGAVSAKAGPDPIRGANKGNRAMTKINLSIDSNDFEITVSETGWANFNLGPIVGAVITEIAKAKGYHIPAKGLRWSSRAKDYRGLGVGFLVEKPEAKAPSAKAEKPSNGGAADPGLGDRLATIEKALAMLLSQGSHAPSAKQTTKKAKAA